MSRQRRINNANNSSTKLTEFEDEHDSPMEEHLVVSPQSKFPWKTVIFIIFFLIGGLICLSCSIIISIGRSYDDRVWPLMILGIMMFIPGGYYGFILASICCKRAGYSFEDLPNL